MTLAEIINSDIKKAMRAKDSKKLAALRAIKSALLLEATGKDRSSGEIPETVELQILKRLVKQRKESAKIYQEQGRPDLAEDEVYQSEIIEAYLPEQLGEEEIKNRIQEIINKTGASAMKDMGKVMGIASKEMAGKADNKLISQIIRTLLNEA